MFRPWGNLLWALNLSPTKKWDFIGCLGTEQRSTAVLIRLAKLGILQQRSLLRIDVRDSPYRDLTYQRLQERERQCREDNVEFETLRVDLLDSIIVTDNVCDGVQSQSVILDITSLPKRYFFYVLKRLYLNEAIKNLIITYTNPAHYRSSALGENIDPWNVLPTFRQPDPQLEAIANKRLIVNVGFMPNGLISHLEGPSEEKQIDLIIPFPAQISAFQRSWQFVWSLTATPHKLRFTEHRVPSNDLSEAFDLITSLSPQDTNLVSFAPFGPKPISAAMCLHSMLTGSPVYYAQPKVYHPDYSTGIGKVGDNEKIYAYWIRHAGKNLYELPAK